MTDAVNDFGEGPRAPRGPSPTTRWAMVLSVGAHLLIPLALLLAEPPAEPPLEPEPMVVTLYEPAPPPPPPPPPEPAPSVAEIPAPPAPATPSPPARPAPKLKVHVARAVAEVPPVYVAPGPVTEPFPSLSDGQLAGAATAGGGGGGSGTGAGGGGVPCDMVERLQSALRRDPDIQAAVQGAGRRTGGRALHVWNGDWVQNPGQAGKGLAGLRQAIAMEVAFAPAACRAQPVRGLVLITLGDGAGAGRLALGAGTWRWSDLLVARR